MRIEIDIGTRLNKNQVLKIVESFSAALVNEGISGEVRVMNRAGGKSFGNSVSSGLNLNLGLNQPAIQRAPSHQVDNMMENKPINAMGMKYDPNTQMITMGDKSEKTTTQLKDPVIKQKMVEKLSDAEFGDSLGNANPYDEDTKNMDSAHDSKLRGQLDDILQGQIRTNS